MRHLHQPSVRSGQDRGFGHLIVDERRHEIGQARRDHRAVVPDDHLTRQVPVEVREQHTGRPMRPRTARLGRSGGIVAARYGQAPIGDPFELFDRCTRVLVMTSLSFDFSGPPLPSNVRYVGPQLDDPDWAARAEWTQPGDQPLVLVALSSVCQHQTDLLRRIARGLGTLPIGVVLTTGRAVDPSQIQAPRNVHVVPAAPHRQVLADAATVVTHAGHGIVMKALAAGLPLVCIPMGRDQKMTCVRLRRALG
jgi:UDP:flavonoid glycosyltransferase YjiC (YdhE family)